MLLTPVNVDSVSLEMLVDFARIMGSFPCMGDDPSRMETVVQILLNASALHPEQRLGHLYGEHKRPLAPSDSSFLVELHCSHRYR